MGAAAFVASFTEEALFRSAGGSFRGGAGVGAAVLFAGTTGAGGSARFEAKAAGIGRLAGLLDDPAVAVDTGGFCFAS